MRRWALMYGAECANVVEQDAEPSIGGVWLDVSGLPVGPGSRLVDGHWLPQMPPQLAAVSMRQAKLALLAAGQLGAVEAAIEAMPEPARSAARIEWASTGMVERAHPTVALIGTAAGLTDEEVDSLFAAAALIV